MINMNFWSKRNEVTANFNKRIHHHKFHRSHLMYWLNGRGLLSTVYHTLKLQKNLFLSQVETAIQRDAERRDLYTMRRVSWTFWQVHDT